jgi:hypothetical protein
MGRLQRSRPQRLNAARIESRCRTINRGAKRKTIGVMAIGIALAFSSLNVSRRGPDGQAGWRVSLVSPAFPEEEYVTALISVLEAAASSATTNSTQASSAGSPLHLGMYVPSNSADQPGSSPGLGFWGGGFDVTNFGSLEQDRALGVTTVTKTPSYHDTLDYGGVYGVYDASRFVPANQSLSIFGTMDIGQNNFTQGPGSLPGQSVSAGWDKDRLVILAGSVRWSIDNVYLKGFGMAVFGDGTQFNTADAGFGSFATRVYAVDATLGDVFVLYNTSGLAPSATTKAPSQTTDGYGGYMLGLDLSGHVGYLDGVFLSGFSDSAGLTQGDFDGKTPLLGAAAKLFATIPGDKFQWTPYVRGAVDDYPGLSFTLTSPKQPLLPTGNVLTILPARTFWTGELGLEVQNDAGWTAGVKGFYMASSDTIIKYAGAYFKISF